MVAFIEEKKCLVGRKVKRIQRCEKRQCSVCKCKTTPSFLQRLNVTLNTLRLFKVKTFFIQFKKKIRPLV